MEPPKCLENILMSIVNSNNGNISEFKVKNMLQELRRGNKVYLLRKSLYDLRQGGRSWYRKLDATLKEIGATPITFRSLSIPRFRGRLDDTDCYLR